MADAFDVQGARDAGYSDDDILGHLQQSRNFDVDGALKAGYSKQDIISHLAGAPTPASAPASTAAPSIGDMLKEGIVSGVFPGAGLIPHAGDVVSGALSGAASTMFHGGDLIRRGLGMKRIIDQPDVQAAMTAPPTIPGTIGRTGEQMAEFMAPAGLVGKGVKAAEAISGGSKILPYLARVAGEGAGAAGVSALQGGDPVSTGALAAAIPALAPVGKTVIRGVSDLIGKSTGAGGEAIREAATTASQKFKDAMRGRVNELDIVQDLKNAVQDIADQRSTEYRQALAQLPTAPLNARPAINAALADQLQKFNIKVTPTGELDFSRSTINNRSAQNDVNQIVNDIRTWGHDPNDMTPLGLDTLKRRIADFYSESGQARAFVKGMQAPVKQVLQTQVPGYQQMTQGYAKASEFLDNIKSELSAGPTAQPGTTIRKLTYALNQNNDYRKILLDAIDNSTGSELKPTIAGFSLKNIMPRGLAGVAASSPFVAGAALAHNPALASGMVFASPRAVGETLALLSTLRRGAPGIGSAVQRAIPAAVSQSTTPPFNPQPIPPPAQ